MNKTDEERARAYALGVNGDAPDINKNPSSHSLWTVDVNRDISAYLAALKEEREIRADKKQKLREMKVVYDEAVYHCAGDDPPWTIIQNYVDALEKLLAKKKK